MKKMNITVICVGKLKEKYLKDGINEYLKRLSKYCNVKVFEVDDEKAPEKLSKADEDIVKKKEGERIKRYIKEGSFIICLAIEGKGLSSEEFADFISKLGVNGTSDITFIIGGSIGLSDEILDMSNYKLSFSKMTFPHQLMRMILLEQIYRGFRIITGEPYHK
jgi:23S rRNA (pseudouridine1915-N3)-methyltransferase